MALRLKEITKETHLEPQQLTMRLFCFNPPSLIVKYAFKYIDLLLAPVVQKVDSAIQRINLYPLDGAIGFPDVYPLDSDLFIRWIALPNFWTPGASFALVTSGGHFGGQEQKHFSSLGTKLYLNYLKKNMNVYQKYLPNQWIAIFARFDWLP